MGPVRRGFFLVEDTGRTRGTNIFFPIFFRGQNLVKDTICSFKQNICFFLFPKREEGNLN